MCLFVECANVSVWIDTRGMWSADGRFYDTKIDHAEQHVHLRGCFALAACLLGLQRNYFTKLRRRPARDGSGRTFGDTAYVYFIFLILSYQLTFYHHGLEHHDLP
jgi:hypothetical protein